MRFSVGAGAGALPQIGLWVASSMTIELPLAADRSAARRAGRRHAGAGRRATRLVHRGLVVHAILVDLLPSSRCPTAWACEARARPSRPLAGPNGTFNTGTPFDIAGAEHVRDRRLGCERHLKQRILRCRPDLEWSPDRVAFPTRRLHGLRAARRPVVDIEAVLSNVRVEQHDPGVAVVVERDVVDTVRANRRVGPIERDRAGFGTDAILDTARIEIRNAGIDMPCERVRLDLVPERRRLRARQVRVLVDRRAAGRGDRSCAPWCECTGSPLEKSILSLRSSNIDP